ncbi:MAG: GNAT family N-acetyltransferase [Defluviitaleaceae bacterium]|nr:GNAT family N-acetyltransferase [Defluviitaleaceae bacterium]
MLTMKWFFADDGLEDAHAIRRAVFIEEQGLTEDEEYDGTDYACTHLVAYENDIPIATGRIMLYGDDYIIGRVAVLKSHRGKNLGLGIMQTLIEACCMMGGERQILHAQTHARGFYEKLGFTAYGEEFEEAGIPHICMEHFGPVKCCGGKV